MYNRGIEKREIYLNPTQYNRFVYYLYLSNSSAPIKLENILKNKRGLTSLLFYVHVARFNRA